MDSRFLKNLRTLENARCSRCLPPWAVFRCCSRCSAVAVDAQDAPPNAHLRAARAAPTAPQTVPQTVAEMAAGVYMQKAWEEFQALVAGTSVQDTFVYTAPSSSFLCSQLLRSLPFPLSSRAPSVYFYAIASRIPPGRVGCLIVWSFACWGGSRKAQGRPPGRRGPAGEGGYGGEGKQSSSEKR